MITHMIPLMVFTSFSGAAAGACIVDAACGSSKACKNPWAFPAVCLLLLAVGLMGTLAHLGQPLRFMNGLSNPFSMISQEAYWSLGFGVVLAADFLVAKTKGRALRAVRIAGAFLALGLIAVTGLAYFDSLGIPAWSGALTVPLFVAGDVVLGVAVCTVFARDDFKGALFVVSVVAAIAFVVVVAGYVLFMGRIGGAYAPAFVAGAACCAASAVVAGVAAGRGGASAGTALSVAGLAALGVVIARCAFFAAGMI